MTPRELSAVPNLGRRGLGTGCRYRREDGLNGTRTGAGWPVAEEACVARWTEAVGSGPWIRGRG